MRVRVRVTDLPSRDDDAVLHLGRLDAHLRVDELPEERDRERAVGLDREVEHPADEAARRCGQRLAARAVEAWLGLGLGPTASTAPARVGLVRVRARVRAVGLGP